MTIHDFHRLEKPREKIAKYGAGKLSDEELLSVILRTGIKGQNILQVSKKIFNKFGKNIKYTQINDLIGMSGIGEAKAAQIVACFELGKRYYKPNNKKIINDPEDAILELEEFSNKTKEHFIALYLDSRNQIIHKDVISIGTVNSSLVHPREVFEPAVKYISSHIIIAHNHPSGNLDPSMADILMTDKLIKAGKILGINIQDHIIFYDKEFYSLRRNEICKFE